MYAGKKKCAWGRDLSVHETSDPVSHADASTDVHGVQIKVCTVELRNTHPPEHQWHQEQQQQHQNEGKRGSSVVRLASIADGQAGVPLGRRMTGAASLSVGSGWDSRLASLSGCSSLKAAEGADSRAAKASSTLRFDNSR